MRDAKQAHAWAAYLPSIEHRQKPKGNALAAGDYSRSYARVRSLGGVLPNLGTSLEKDKKDKKHKKDQKDQKKRARVRSTQGTPPQQWKKKKIGHLRRTKVADCFFRLDDEECLRRLNFVKDFKRTQDEVICKKKLKYCLVPPMDWRPISSQAPLPAKMDRVTAPVVSCKYVAKAMRGKREKKMFARDCEGVDLTDLMAETEQKAVFELIFANKWYALLRLLHYSYAIIAPPIDGVGYADFIKLLKNCSIIDAIITTSFAAQAFEAINVREHNHRLKQGLAVDKPDHILDLKELMILMVVVAVAKYKGQGLGATEAVARLFEQHIIAGMRACDDPMGFRAILRADKQLSAVVDRHYKLLSNKFEHYCGANKDMLSKDDNSIDMMEFQGLLGDYKLWDARLHTRLLLRVLCMSRDENQADPYALRLPAFIELLIRCACLKYGGPPLAYGNDFSEAVKGKPGDVTQVSDTRSIHECAAAMFKVLASPKPH